MADSVLIGGVWVSTVPPADVTAAQLATKVSKTGDTMTGDLVVPDEAYNATTWNGSLEVPTKNALRDKIETIVSSTGTFDFTPNGKVEISAVNDGSSTQPQLRAFKEGAVSAHAGLGSYLGLGALSLGISGSLGSIILMAGSASGVTSVVPPSAAGGTITLPTGTATLATTAGTVAKSGDTMTGELVVDRTTSGKVKIETANDGAATQSHVRVYKNGASTAHASLGSYLGTGALGLGLEGTGSNVFLYGSSSGFTTLQPAAAAGGTVVLPSITTTLVGRGTTDTLTNKTLTSPVINNFGTASGMGAAWTSYTPQVDQGVTTNIAKTVNYAAYQVYGKTCVVGIRMAMTAAGTSGSSITVSLPLPEAVTAVNVQCGSGNLFDASASLRYRGICQITGGSQNFVMFRTDGTGTSTIGADPVLALASGDILNASLIYEIA